MAALWDAEICDLTNPYADDRADALIALNHRILLHAEDPQTWRDVHNEIAQHLKTIRRLMHDGVHRARLSEAYEFLCILWEMRRLLERTRNSPVRGGR